MTTSEEYARYDMTSENLTLNELADAAAKLSAEVHGRHPMAIRRDEEQLIESYLIALRLAIIEVAVWGASLTDNSKRGPTLKSPKTRAEAEKRKLGESLEATSGHGHNHSLYDDDRGKWRRCRDCRGFALVGNAA